MLGNARKPHSGSRLFFSSPLSGRFFNVEWQMAMVHLFTGVFGVNYLFFTILAKKLESVHRASKIQHVEEEVVVMGVVDSGRR